MLGLRVCRAEFLRTANGTSSWIPRPKSDVQDQLPSPGQVRRRRDPVAAQRWGGHHCAAQRPRRPRRTGRHRGFRSHRRRRDGTQGPRGSAAPGAKDGSRRQLAGGVAHDFNNLLTVITGYTQILMDQHSKNAQASHSIEQIFGAADRAALLTRQLLAFSRRQMLQPRLVSLNTLVRNSRKCCIRCWANASRLWFALLRIWRRPGRSRTTGTYLDESRGQRPRCYAARGTITVETANADLTEAFSEPTPEHWPDSTSCCR